MRAGPGIGWLIAGRAVQGAGAALVITLGLALLSAAFPAEKRGAAIGIFSAITGLAVASGPLVGGAVVEGISWEWIFWVNVPIGLIALPLVLARIQESRGPESALDLVGLGLVSGGAFGVVWGLVRGNQAGWGSFEVVAMLTAGVVLFAAFVAWELRAREPMLPMSFFRSRAFSAGNGAIFLTLASLFTGVFFFAQFLQTAMDHGPLGAGLRLLPWTATFMTVAPIAGALADRIGERPLMSTGLALEAVGLAWLALIAEPGMAYSSMLAPFIVAGVGVSMAIPAAQNSVIGSVHPDGIGKAAGVNSMMREMGGVFGIAVTVAVFAGAGGYASAERSWTGSPPAIGVAAGMAALGSVVALALPGRRSPAAPATTGVDPVLEMEGRPDAASAIVHLELHTRERGRARDLYAELCGWSAERIGRGRASYLALELGEIGGGIVECAAPRPVWVPYVEVLRVAEVTERARRLGASVLLEPREGAYGWRSVVSTVQGGEIAFWQPKRGRGR